MTATATAPDGGDLWLQFLRDRFDPTRRRSRWNSPGQMAAAFDRNHIQTPALDIIDAELVDVADGRTQRLIVNLGPQEGKSQAISINFPVWLLQRNPNLRIAIVSNAANMARRFGRRIRNTIRAHPELGLTLSQSSQRQDEFELVGYDGGVVCVGVDGQLTSRPVDVLIIDDPYKNAGDADSKAWAKTVREFWTETALARLAPGTPVVLVQTRWREDDLAGWLAKEHPDLWKVVRLPAQADHDPERGETDPLGREPGEWLISTRGRTAEDWEQRRREVGSRPWAAQYQGRPSPETGSYFHRAWWADGRARFDQPLWLEREDGTRIVTGMDELLTSWDLSFKDGDGTDLVAGGVWGRRGVDIYLLDLVWRRMDFPATCDAVRQLAARWPQCVLHVVEDKANGPAVLASLRRVVPGLVPEEPQGSKQARAAAASPLGEAGNLWLPTPELAPWVGAAIDELAGFPTAAHDDFVDQLTQAANRLILQPLIEGRDLGDGSGVVRAEELLEDLAGFGSFIPG